MAQTKLYPLAAPNGAPIPLDIIKPEKAAVLSVGQALTLGTDAPILLLTAVDHPALVRFYSGTDVPSQIAAGAWSANALLLPANLPMIVTPPDGTTAMICYKVAILPTSPSAILVQAAVQWAGVGLTLQTSVK